MAAAELLLTMATGRPACVGGDDDLSGVRRGLRSVDCDQLGRAQFVLDRHGQVRVIRWWR